LCRGAKAKRNSSCTEQPTLGRVKAQCEQKRDGGKNGGDFVSTAWSLATRGMGEEDKCGSFVMSEHEKGKLHSAGRRSEKVLWLAFVFEDGQEGGGGRNILLLGMFGHWVSQGVLRLRREPRIVISRPDGSA